MHFCFVAPGGAGQDAFRFPLKKARLPPMKSTLLLLSSLLGMATAADASSILWVSDNGPELNAPNGVFYPPVSPGIPYADQGFVDLLISAGHRVTRYNPNSNGFRDSQADIPAINGYDLIILGSALNSGPFNLATRGAYWNTAITKPVIVTKSTLIKSDRMGWLLGNKEFDSAADSCTTASGKLTLLQPAHPLFSGIARTAGVMNNFSGILVPAPLNNRGTTLQILSLSISGVDQAIANAIEPGGVALATLEFNPLNPVTAPAAGAAPTVDSTHLAHGYAIAEWPAATIVRTAALPGGESLAGYRLFFACGTRDAVGAVASAPNPAVGALDLSADGRKLFLNAVGRALNPPATLVLSSTWGQYDKTEIVNGGAGILSLTNESATGFTASVGENTLSNNVVPTPGIDGAGRPRIFQTFNPQSLSGVGQQARMSFKIKFNDIPASGDTRFRFGFADTAHNQGVLGMIDLGAPSNPSGRLRSDLSISGTGSVLSNYLPGDWSDFGNTGAAPGATGTALQTGSTIGAFDGAPNGVGLVDTTTTHVFTMTLERVAGGLSWTVTWGNDQGPEILSMATTNVVDDSLLPMNSVDSIGIMNLNHNTFGAVNSNTTGSFVVSEVSVTGEGHTTSGSVLPFETSGSSLAGTDLQVTWNSTPGVIYSIVSSSDLKTWTLVPGAGSIVAADYTSSFTLSNQTATRQYYQIRR